MGEAGRFFMVDVETANADYSSICQIGIVEFDASGLLSEWVTLVNPEDDFDGFNVSIHGIEPKDVADAPTFPDIVPEVGERLGAGLALSYSIFDRSSIWQAHEKYGIAAPNYDWLDATRIVRRTWSSVAHGGYKLKQVARMLKIKMERHHDALSDARAAGMIILEAVKVSGIGLDAWRTMAYKSITPEAKAIDVLSGITAEDIDPDGPLSGECVVFTGELRLPRREAMARAYKAGAQVGDGVTKKTTLLVVGTQDLAKVKSDGKSNKQMKAEALIIAGQDIEIATEDSFYRTISMMGGAA